MMRIRGRRGLMVRWKFRGCDWLVRVTALICKRQPAHNSTTLGDIFYKRTPDRETLDMYRNAKNATSPFLVASLSQKCSICLTTPRHFASKKGNATHAVWDEAELSKARNWLSKFNISSIPRNICAISFSRSSGPGGQNVNK